MEGRCRGFEPGSPGFAGRDTVIVLSRSPSGLYRRPHEIVRRKIVNRTKREMNHIARNYERTSLVIVQMIKLATSTDTLTTIELWPAECSRFSPLWGQIFHHLPPWGRNAQGQPCMQRPLLRMGELHGWHVCSPFHATTRFRDFLWATMPKPSRNQPFPNLRGIFRFKLNAPPISRGRIRRDIRTVGWGESATAYLTSHWSEKRFYIRSTSKYV